MPVSIGTVVRKVAMARFSRTLSTLIASGVDIMKALEITAPDVRATGSSRRATLQVRPRVQEGAPIAQPMIESPIFPPMVGADGEDRRGDR